MTLLGIEKCHSYKLILTVILTDSLYYMNDNLGILFCHIKQLSYYPVSY